MAVHQWPPPWLHQSDAGPYTKPAESNIRRCLFHKVRQKTPLRNGYSNSPSNLMSQRPQAPLLRTSVYPRNSLHYSQQLDLCSSLSVTKFYTQKTNKIKQHCKRAYTVNEYTYTFFANSELIKVHFCKLNFKQHGPRGLKGFQCRTSTITRHKEVQLCFTVSESQDLHDETWLGQFFFHSTVMFLILAIQKNYRTIFLYFFKLYYHTSLYGRTASGASVDHTSQVFLPATLVLQIA
jgi:hypothetical protein